MKNLLFLFSLLLIMLSAAGCSRTAEENTIPTIDNSTKQTIEKLQHEEDQAMNFSNAPVVNTNSTEGVQDNNEHP